MKTPLKTWTLTGAVLLVALSGGISEDAEGGELLALEMPREGLMANAAEYARMGPEEYVSPAEGVRGYCEMLSDLCEAYDSLPVVHYFFCTVYYTPMEAGFTAERGFDMTPETRGSLGGRKFAKSFLRTVTMEGYGRLAEPVNGRDYVKYDGTWGYNTRALGNRNNTLVDRESAAVHRRNRLFSKGTRMMILDPVIYNAFGDPWFEAADTGGGLFRSQIDLFWGDDVPLGPGPGLYRPASCPISVRWIVPVLVFR